MNCSYTKMGYAGNSEPSFIIPTALASYDDGARDIGARGATDLDYYIGDAALANAKTHQLQYPIRHGLIDNWSSMERLWQRCFYEQLHVNPSEHHVMLTEPPLNPPENREYTCEVMFETFNVPGEQADRLARVMCLCVAQADPIALQKRFPLMLTLSLLTVCAALLLQACTLGFKQCWRWRHRG